MEEGSAEAKRVLETRGLSKSFGRQRAVDSVSISVRRGDVYGFLGLNGAGKTTTLRMLLGLLRPDAGQVALFGVTSAKKRLAARARIGAMVEGPSFYPHLTGRRNLELLGALKGATPDRRHVDDVLKTVGLDDAANKRAGHYSLGMKQRLGIALALIGSPELVILDEPTNGLDPNGIIEMRRLIRRLNRDEGVTFVVSSHLLHEIERVCNRVAILEKGRLLVEEDVSELLAGLGGRYRLKAAPRDVVLRLLAETEGVTVKQSPDDVIIFEAEPNLLPRIHSRLAAAPEISVYTLAEERNSLEDFFLRTSKALASGELS